MPASRARDRKVLSTPKRTSAIGLSLVRMAWLTTDPASPARSTLMVAPVWAVNAASTSSDTADESCVRSVISVAGGVGPEVGAGLGAGVAQAASTKERTT